MKQIKVNNNCDGCGLCIVNSMYLEENDEGYAKPIAGKAIKDSDMEKLKEVVNNCPQKALSIIETGKATALGKDGVKQIIENLKKQCNLIKVKKINNSDIKLSSKNHLIIIPTNSKMFETYTSESSARSAAKDVFNHICFSEYAYKPLLKKIFVEYKVNVLKPYYTCEDISESAYYKYNEIIRKQLADAYAEVCDLLGEGKLAKVWKNFSVYPKDKEWEIEFLKTFDKLSTNCGIISKLKEFSDLDDYINEVFFDYHKQYIGESFFGKEKYKKIWYFNMGDAESKFIDDLKWAIDYRSDEIEDRALNLINPLFDTFEKEIKKEYMKKIEELEKLVQSL